MTNTKLNAEMLTQLEHSVGEMERCQGATEAAMENMTLTVEPWFAAHLHLVVTSAPALVAAAKELADLRKINDGLRLDIEHARAERDALIKRIEVARKHLQTPHGVKLEDSARLTAEALAACHVDLVAAHGALPADCGEGSIGERIARVVAQRDEARSRPMVSEKGPPERRKALEHFLMRARHEEDIPDVLAELEAFVGSPTCATIEAKDLAHQILAITDVTFTSNHGRMMALGEVHDLAGQVLRVALDRNPARETQRTISDWANATFGPSSSNARCASRANNEMSELVDALVSDDQHPKAIEEAADVVIVLYRLVDRMGGDMHAAIDAKMKINRERRWTIASGHGQHVPEEES